MILMTVIGDVKELKSLDDTQLMVAVQQGDAMAFRILVDRYKKKAYYTALKLVGDPDDAYDLSQEAFIRVYNARRLYDKNHPFYSWFYTILRNLTRNYLQKRSVRFKYALRVKRTRMRNPEVSDSPQCIAEADEAKKAVWTAIRKLSHEHREIIVLRHFEDLSYEEIAKLLGIAVGSVMSRLYYARKKLRDLLGEEYAVR
jgi:RNA polymerase sigma-70 factor (ECF subfamily)